MARLMMNQGLNTAQDRSFLDLGELTLATGAYYRPGDTFRLWKILGRTTYGDAYAATSNAVGLAHFAFDNGADKLIVHNTAGEFHMSTITSGDATAGTFATLTTGLTIGATILSWAHFDNKWYFSNAKDRPFVLKDDNTLRKMGMMDPNSDPIATATTGTYTGRVTTATFTGSEWSAPTLGYDGDLDTKAFAWMRDVDPANTEKTIVFSAAAASTASNRVAIVNWSLRGLMMYGDEPYRPTREREFRVKTTFWKSEDNGGSWTTILDGTYQVARPLQSLQTPISADSDQVQIRARITQLLSNPTRSAALQVHDTRITNDGFTPIFTSTDGVFYGIAEYSEVDDLESPLVISNLVTFASQNVVNLSLPTKVNDHATHFKIYRTHDGGRAPGDFRMLDLIDITETSWTDTFAFDKDSVGGEVPPLLKLQITDTINQYYPSNSAPEAFKSIVEYQNFLVAISEQFPRRLSYSMPGEPEYWPVLYQVVDFPLKEHDKLTALGVAGDLLLVAAEEALIVINGLPELEAQSYARANMTVLRGAPGCVGPKAMVEYSLHGEPRVVYVSEQGIYETNGHTIRELSSDLDWANTVNLGTLQNTWMFWDKEDQIMKVGLDTTGDALPDREYWIHLADEHRKQNGRPKITGPHYSSKTNEVGGRVPDGRYRVYSLDNDSTGTVYHEKDGGTDSGNFYNTLSQVPLDARTGRIYGPQLHEWAVDFPTVRHTSWNNTALAVSWIVGRDEIGESDTALNTMTISTQGQTKFVVARSGEWHEVRVQSTANAGAGASIGSFEHSAIPMNLQGDTQDS
jgi:hypothetical protein